MAPRIEPVATDDVLPAQVDVVIVGAGIIGTSAALFLARKGISCLVCEKGHIAGEQSSRNWGWCRNTGRDPVEIPLMLESLRLWDEMNEMTQMQTGFTRAGIAQLCTTAAELEKCERWLDCARAYQVDARFISKSEIDHTFGRTGKNWLGVLYSSSDGRAEPSLATPAIAAAARKAGALLVTNCAVRGYETQGGLISAAVTEKGRVRCRSLVVAGGVWSRLFVGNDGIDFPQLKVMTSVLRTTKIENGPQGAAIGRGFSFRKHSDGGYVISQANRNVVDVGPDNLRLFGAFFPVLKDRWKTIKLRYGRQAVEEWMQPRHWSLDQISPFEKQRVVDPKPYEPFLKESLENAGNAFPVFKNAGIAESWGGMLDVTPDALPVICSIDERPGLFVASGFSGHGFGLGPAAGKLAADMVCGNTPSVDPNPFHIKRFNAAIYPKPSPLAM